MNKIAIILVNWKQYAQKYIDDLSEGLEKQDYSGKIKVFVVDNESSEETRKLIAEKMPRAEIIPRDKNEGFTGNNYGIKKALKEGYEYIVLFNFDIILDKSCVRKMIEAFDKDEKIASVQARMMLYPETNKINSLGNNIHFLGFGYCSGYQERWTGALEKISEIAYPSGAAVMFRAEFLKKIGLFDEEYFMYNEDEDLGWRIWLLGYKNIINADAFIYHKYEFSRSIKKYYWMERNRMITAIKNYHILSLILFFPPFLAMELGTFIFALKGGWWKEKLYAYKWFLNFKNCLYVFRERKKIQKLRKVSDRYIIKKFSGKIWYQEIDDWKLHLINPVFAWYFKLAQKIIFW